jgi:hypothetical protein
MATDAKTTLALTALALIVPSATSAFEIREQPADVRRTEVASVEWIGAPATDVSVEYRHGLDWVPVASGLPSQETGGDLSSARWQPGRQAPEGTYRMRVEAAGETVVSDYFTVRPCECLLPSPVRAHWRSGSFRLSMTAEYAAAGIGELRLAREPVQTGRPLVRVLRDGRRQGSVRLRYRDGAFRGKWAAPRHPRASVVFKLVALRDAFGNS